MQCSGCGHDNLPDAKYCANCGAAMAPEGIVNCAKCRQANPRDAGFCSNCGNALAPGCPSCSRQDDRNGIFCRWCDHMLVGPQGVKAAGLGRRVGAFILEFVLLIVTLIIGYIIWWLFTLSRGQTPGKQLLGIRVMRADGTRSDWGWTFLREFAIKGLVFGGLSDALTGGIASIVDLLWAFWDKDRQTLHDKIMKTVVVDDRAFRSVPA